MFICKTSRRFLELSPDTFHKCGMDYQKTFDRRLFLSFSFFTDFHGFHSLGFTCYGSSAPRHPPTYPPIPSELSRSPAAPSSDGGSSFSRRALLENAASTTFAASVIATLGGTGGAAPAQAKPQRVKGGGPIITLDDGAQYQEMTIGDGPTPRDGDRVAVHYSLYYGGEERTRARVRCVVAYGWVMQDGVLM